MTAEMPPETPFAAHGRWFPVAVVGALVLAVAAGIYRHEEHDDARRAEARHIVVSGQTRDLEAKVATAQANLEASRRRLRAQAPSSAALSKVLDQLTANNASMSSIVHDQNASSARIVAALAGNDVSTYNKLVDRFTASSRSVNALAVNESILRDELTRSTCGQNCATTEDADHFGTRPGGQSAAG